MFNKSVITLKTYELLHNLKYESMKGIAIYIQAIDGITA